MVSPAQKRAQDKYNQKNRKKIQYITYKSTAKSFIKNRATKEDLQMLRDLINEQLTNH